MNNEAILNKLVELGYIDFTSAVHMDSFMSAFVHKDININYFVIVLDALIAECGKQGLCIQIMSGDLYIQDDFESIKFEAPYSRQAIIEAFCKVTGVEL